MVPWRAFTQTSYSSGSCARVSNWLMSVPFECYPYLHRASTAHTNQLENAKKEGTRPSFFRSRPGGDQLVTGVDGVGGLAGVNEALDALRAVDDLAVVLTAGVAPVV